MTDLFIEAYGGAGVPAVFLHGSFGWGIQSFPKQLALQTQHQLLFVDRRGFGRSPDPAPGLPVDFDTDAADLVEIVGKLGEAAHVVGHSYGAVPCMLAAQQMPQLFCSMVLIEPSAFSLLRGNPAVERFIERIYAAVALASAEGATPQEILAGFVAAMGYDRPSLSEPEPILARSICASATERRPWEAQIDVESLQRAAIPTLIVSGAWDAAPPPAQEIGGAAFHAVADRLSELLPNCRREFVAGAAHNPQMLAEDFNPLVESFWSGVEAEEGDIGGNG